TLGQLSLVEFVLRPGPPEKDEQIADRRDRITPLFYWSRFSLSQEPMGEPAVDGFAAGLVGIVIRVYLDRRQLVFGVEEFVYPADRRVFGGHHVLGPVTGGRHHHHRTRRHQARDLHIVGVDSQIRRVLADAAALHQE